MKNVFFFLLIIFCFFCVDVYAHPGRTDSSGCHKCNASNTNCAKWGLQDYEYHCHSGGIYTNSKGQKFNSNGDEIVESNNNVSNESNNSTNQPESDTPLKQNESSKNQNIKSNDNSLKKLIIEDQVYENFENVIYTTFKEKINIEVIPNNNKANYEIQGQDSLKIGENLINIIVKAEDGTTKNYNFIINRKKILSSEVGVNITIDGEKIIFNDYKSTIYIDSSTTKVDIDYVLTDKNAILEMSELNELIIGENLLKIKVTAEDGTIQDYEIIIYRYSKTEDVIYTTLGLGLLGGTGYGVYYIVKKNKRKLFLK